VFKLKKTVQLMKRNVRWDTPHMVNKMLDD